MSWSLALTAAALAGLGTWLAMDRSLTRILLGLGLWGHAAVLLLLVAGGRAGRSPIGVRRRAGRRRGWRTPWCRRCR